MASHEKSLDVAAVASSLTGGSPSSSPSSKEEHMLLSSISTSSLTSFSSLSTSTSSFSLSSSSYSTNSSLSSISTTTSLPFSKNTIAILLCHLPNDYQIKLDECLKELPVQPIAQERVIENDEWSIRLIFLSSDLSISTTTTTNTSTTTTISSKKSELSSSSPLLLSSESSQLSLSSVSSGVEKLIAEFTSRGFFAFCFDLHSNQNVWTIVSIVGPKTQEVISYFREQKGQSLMIMAIREVAASASAITATIATVDLCTITTESKEKTENEDTLNSNVSYLSSSSSSPCAATAAAATAAVLVAIYSKTKESRTGEQECGKNEVENLVESLKLKHPSWGIEEKYNQPFVNFLPPEYIGKDSTQSKGDIEKIFLECLFKPESSLRENMEEKVEAKGKGAEVGKVEVIEAEEKVEEEDEAIETEKEKIKTKENVNVKMSASGEGGENLKINEVVEIKTKENANVKMSASGEGGENLKINEVVEKNIRYSVASIEKKSEGDCLQRKGSLFEEEDKENCPPMEEKEVKVENENEKEKEGMKKMDDEKTETELVLKSKIETEEIKENEKEIDRTLLIPKNSNTYNAKMLKIYSFKRFLSDAVVAPQELKHLRLVNREESDNAAGHQCGRGGGDIRRNFNSFKRETADYTNVNGVNVARRGQLRHDWNSPISPSSRNSLSGPPNSQRGIIGPPPGLDRFPSDLGPSQAQVAAIAEAAVEAAKRRELFQQRGGRSSPSAAVGTKTSTTVGGNQNNNPAGGGANFIRGNSAKPLDPAAPEFKPRVNTSPNPELVRTTQINLVEMVKNEGKPIPLENIASEYFKRYSVTLDPCQLGYVDILAFIETVHPSLLIELSDRRGGRTRHENDIKKALSLPVLESEVYQVVKYNCEFIPPDLKFFQNLLVGLVADCTMYDPELKPEMTPTSVGMPLTRLPAEWKKKWGGLYDLKNFQGHFGVPRLQPFLEKMVDLQVITTPADVKVRVTPGTRIPHVPSSANFPGPFISLPEDSPISLPKSPLKGGGGVISLSMPPPPPPPPPPMFSRSPTGTFSRSLNATATSGTVSPNATAAMFPFSQFHHLLQRGNSPQKRSVGGVMQQQQQQPLPPPSSCFPPPPPVEAISPACSMSLTPPRSMTMSPARSVTLSSGSSPGRRTSHPNIMDAFGNNSSSKSTSGGVGGNDTRLLGQSNSTASSVLQSFSMATSSSLVSGNAGPQQQQQKLSFVRSATVAALTQQQQQQRSNSYWYSDNLVSAPVLSRMHLHKLLFELIVAACHRQKLRWERGEDLIELEEELLCRSTSAEVRRNLSFSEKKSSSSSSGGSGKKNVNRTQQEGGGSLSLKENEDEDVSDVESEEEDGGDAIGSDDERLERRRRKKREKKEKRRRRKLKVRELEREQQLFGRTQNHQINTATVEIDDITTAHSAVATDISTDHSPTVTENSSTSANLISGETESSSTSGIIGDDKSSTIGEEELSEKTQQSESSKKKNEVETEEKLQNTITEIKTAAASAATDMKNSADQSTLLTIIDPISPIKTNTENATTATTSPTSENATTATTSPTSENATTATTSPTSSSGTVTTPSSGSPKIQDGVSLSNSSAVGGGDSSSSSSTSSKGDFDFAEYSSSNITSSSGSSSSISNSCGATTTIMAPMAVTTKSSNSAEIVSKMMTDKLCARRQSYRTRAIGVLVSSIKNEWVKRYGEQFLLTFYMGYFGVKKMKFLLLEVPNVIITGSGGFMRVTTTEHAKYFCKPYPPQGMGVDGKTPVVSTFTSVSTLPCFQASNYKNVVDKPSPVTSPFSLSLPPHATTTTTTTIANPSAAITSAASTSFSRIKNLSPLLHQPPVSTSAAAAATTSNGMLHWKHMNDMAAAPSATFLNAVETPTTTPVVASLTGFGSRFGLANPTPTMTSPAASRPSPSQLAAQVQAQVEAHNRRKNFFQSNTTLLNVSASGGSASSNTTTSTTTTNSAATSCSGVSTSATGNLEVAPTTTTASGSHVTPPPHSTTTTTSGITLPLVMRNQTTENLEMKSSTEESVSSSLRKEELREKKTSSNFRFHLHRLMYSLIAKVCQEQHAKHLLAKAQGQNLSAYEIAAATSHSSMGFFDDQPDEEFTSTARNLALEAEAEKEAQELLRYGVYGLKFVDIRYEWFNMYKCSLQPLMEKAKFAHTGDLVRSLHNVHIVGKGREGRCIVALPRGKISSSGSKFSENTPRVGDMTPVSSLLINGGRLPPIMEPNASDNNNNREMAKVCNSTETSMISHSVGSSPSPPSSSSYTSTSWAPSVNRQNSAVAEALRVMQQASAAQAAAMNALASAVLIQPGGGADGFNASALLSLLQNQNQSSTSLIEGCPRPSYPSPHTLSTISPNYNNTSNTSSLPSSVSRFTASSGASSASGSAALSSFFPSRIPPILTSTPTPAPTPTSCRTPPPNDSASPCFSSPQYGGSGNFGGTNVGGGASTGSSTHGSFVGGGTSSPVGVLSSSHSYNTVKSRMLGATNINMQALHKQLELAAQLCQQSSQNIASSNASTTLTTTGGAAAAPANSPPPHHFVSSSQPHLPTTIRLEDLLPNIPAAAAANNNNNSGLLPLGITPTSYCSGGSGNDHYSVMAGGGSGCGGFVSPSSLSLNNEAAAQQQPNAAVGVATSSTRDSDPRPSKLSPDSLRRQIRELERQQQQYSYGKKISGNAMNTGSVGTVGTTTVSHGGGGGISGNVSTTAVNLNNNNLKMAHNHTNVGLNLFAGLSQHQQHSLRMGNAASGSGGYVTNYTNNNVLGVGGGGQQQQQQQSLSHQPSPVQSLFQHFKQQQQQHGSGCVMMNDSLQPLQQQLKSSESNTTTTNNIKNGRFGGVLAAANACGGRGQSSPSRYNSQPSLPSVGGGSGAATDIFNTGVLASLVMSSNSAGGGGYLHPTTTSSTTTHANILSGLASSSMNSSTSSNISGFPLVLGAGGGSSNLRNYNNSDLPPPAHGSGMMVPYGNRYTSSHSSNPVPQRRG